MDNSNIMHYCSVEPPSQQLALAAPGVFFFFFLVLSYDSLFMVQEITWRANSRFHSYFAVAHSRRKQV